MFSSAKSSSNQSGATVISAPQPRSNNRPDSYRTLTGNEGSKEIADEDNGSSIALVPGKGWSRASQVVEAIGGAGAERDAEKGEMQPAGEIGVKRDIRVSSRIARR